MYISSKKILMDHLPKQGTISCQRFQSMFQCKLSWHSCPIVQFTTIRVILTIVVTKGWPLHQLDINNAFLQGTFEMRSSWSNPMALLTPGIHLMYVS